MKFLTVEEVIEAHTRIVQTYGGLDGIRDMGLLISAIEMPKASFFGEFLHVTIFNKAAAYLFHIVCNHPFLDGNKRSGSAAALIFLEMNGIELEFDEREFEELVVKTAQGKSNKEEISQFFCLANQSKKK
jgi:death on curing protein